LFKYNIKMKYILRRTQLSYKRVVFDEVYILFHFNIILKHNGMSSTKIITASQARYVSQYKNLKSKVMKDCANICFTCHCLKQIR
jgi:hypothetical protein